jgi:hypothetical protein
VPEFPRKAPRQSQLRRCEEQTGGRAMMPSTGGLGFINRNLGGFSLSQDVAKPLVDYGAQGRERISVGAFLIGPGPCEPIPLLIYPDHSLPSCPPPA